MLKFVPDNLDAASWAVWEAHWVNSRFQSRAWLQIPKDLERPWRFSRLDKVAKNTATKLQSARNNVTSYHSLDSLCSSDNTIEKGNGNF